jgi:hypothetical protein
MVRGIHALLLLVLVAPFALLVNAQNGEETLMKLLSTDPVSSTCNPCVCHSLERRNEQTAPSTQTYNTTTTPHRTHKHLLFKH